MVAVKLIGSPLCRRYQQMRRAVIQASDHLGIELALEEFGDPEDLAAFSPLSLPRLYLQDRLVASQNPPTLQVIALALQNVPSK